jgi:glyoxylase-like metal-dependent hydrolase (beta-lactamase superfamily II)
MNNTPSELTYPLAPQRPAAGQVLDVADGVRWLRMALPFALDHINLWLLRDHFDGRDGWTVVDTCIDHPDARAAWEGVFQHHLDGLPIVRVVITHMHPDHIGLAHWLCERWQAPMWISLGDYLNARMGSGAVRGFGADAARSFFTRHGISDPEHIQAVGLHGPRYGDMVPKVPANYRRLLDGQTLAIGSRTWRCIVGYGHAPEHMALYDEQGGVLISGDMVLPRISTNVSVYETEPEGDPLGLFLSSLDRYLALPADTLVLPSHGEPFIGLHARVTQLKQHHAERLTELIQACRNQPKTALDILPVLFKRKLDAHQLAFAMGEAIAHLNHLWHQQRLTRSVDAQHVHRFVAA